MVYIVVLCSLYADSSSLDEEMQMPSTKSLWCTTIKTHTHTFIHSFIHWAKEPESRKVQHTNTRTEWARLKIVHKFAWFICTARFFVHTLPCIFHATKMNATCSRVVELFCEKQTQRSKKNIKNNVRKRKKWFGECADCCAASRPHPISELYIFMLRRMC